MTGHVGALDIPPNASFDQEASEVLRAWVTRGNLEVSLKRGWDEPGAWGILLVDLARHAARAFAYEGICSEDHALERIRSLLDVEWFRPTDLGSTQQSRKQ